MKTGLFEVYDKLLQEELTHKIFKVEAASDGRQHGEAWNLVNEISGRKKSKSGQISGLTGDHEEVGFTVNPGRSRRTRLFSDDLSTTAFESGS